MPEVSPTITLPRPSDKDSACRTRGYRAYAIGSVQVLFWDLFRETRDVRRTPCMDASELMVGRGNGFLQILADASLQAGIDDGLGLYADVNGRGSTWDGSRVPGSWGCRLLSERSGTIWDTREREVALVWFVCERWRNNWIVEVSLRNLALSSYRKSQKRYCRTY